MRRKGLAAAAIWAMALLSPVAHAADHRDGSGTSPGVQADPSTDLNDVFAWMSADKSKMYLVMNVFPAATSASRFSNVAKYVFHLNASATFGMPPTAKAIICTFDTNQLISCWGPGNEYVTGDASNVAGLSSASGKMKVFAGLRNDPFFFNLEGFKDMAATVKGAKASLTLDPSGCPAIDGATSTVLVNTLKATMGNTMPAKDFFKGLNTLAIVVAVDTALVTESGAKPIVGVWASTNQ